VQQQMVVRLAEQTYGLFFEKFQSSNIPTITKPLSLFSTMKTWARNERTKIKQAKSFRINYSNQQVDFLEKVFSESHEKIIAYNVFLALIRVGAL